MECKNSHDDYVKNVEDRLFKWEQDIRNCLLVKASIDV